VKDHEIAQLVNALRDTAVQFHDHDSLRERIAHLVVPAINRLRAQAIVAKHRDVLERLKDR
jgi:hypothetical protein